MAYDLLLRKETDSNWARGQSKPLALEFTKTERRNFLLLEPSTREFVMNIIIWARGKGIPAKLGETYRSQEDQDTAIREGRSGIREEGRIGWHQVGRAFHLVIIGPDGKLDREAYQRVGEEVRRLGGDWLGDRPLKTRRGIVEDLAHFEFHPGYNIASYRRSPVAANELKSAVKRAAKYA